ncbi:hypothetical protein OHR68_35690 [Spirillospora sp. NBC_00431]
MEDVCEEARAHDRVRAEDVEKFVEVSETLTGFSRYDLRGTGMAELYLDTVRRQIGASNYDALVALLAKAPATSPDWQKHPALLEAARAIAYLWYTGAWPRMAPAAHAELRRQMANEEFVVSSSAYTEGLVWRTFHGHPAGAKPPGYGTWSMKPPPVPGIDEILDELEPDFAGRSAVFTTPVSAADIAPSMLPGLASDRYVAPSAQPRATTHPGVASRPGTAARSQTAHPGADQPRGAQPGADQPRTEQSGAERAGVERAGVERPGVAQSTGDQPRAEQSGGDEAWGGQGVVGESGGDEAAGEEKA